LNIAPSPLLTNVDSIQSGEKLLAKCISDSITEKAFCGGYIIGIADALTSNSINGFTACLPNGTKAREVVNESVKWLALHADVRKFDAEGLIASALSEAFPCKK
jgi:hypothetical protein